MTTVLITGASSGIGRALAKRYAQEGCDLVLTARSEERLHALAAELDSVRVDSVVADLSRREGPTDLLGAIERVGLGVDVLVNNAGAGLYGRFAETSLDRERELIQLNLTSVLELTKRLLPAMLARGSGHVINVASAAAFVPGPYQSVYYASKAAILSFSEALAEEIRGTGVGVTVVCPGPVRTDFQGTAGVRRARPTPPGMFVTADAVADATVRGMRAGRRTVVPGWRQRLLVLAVQLAPRRLVAWGSERAAAP